MCDPSDLYRTNLTRYAITLEIFCKCALVSHSRMNDQDITILFPNFMTQDVHVNEKVVIKSLQKNSHTDWPEYM